MCLLDVVPTLPVVDHHEVPNLIDVLFRRLVLLKLGHVLLSRFKRLNRGICDIDHLGFLPNARLCLLFFCVFSDFFNVDVSLFEDLKMFALEWKLNNFHKAAALVHLDIEAMDLPDHHVEVVSYLRCREISDVFHVEDRATDTGFSSLGSVCDLPRFLYDIEHLFLFVREAKLHSLPRSIRYDISVAQVAAESIALDVLHLGGILLDFPG